MIGEVLLNLALLGYVILIYGAIVVATYIAWQYYIRGDE